MKNILLSLIVFCGLQNHLHSQSPQDKIVGTWLGKLNVGIDLRIVFHIENIQNELQATMDSPDQGVNGIQTMGTNFSNDILKIEVPIIGGNYNGKYNTETKTIEGTWFQSGGSYTLNLNKVDSVTPLFRPQEPMKPYPYLELEVTFENQYADSVILSGTITIPKGNGPFPAVVLVSGSGPQDRNETLLGHAPFLVLSDFLTRQGILVLRYDDRGTARSTGDFHTATSEDFMQDAQAAVNYLKTRKDIPIQSIGIIGHSEGGLIAPLAASINKNIDFIVLLAGPGIPGDSILKLQSNLIAKASGYSDAARIALNALLQEILTVIKTENDQEMIKQKLIEINKKFIRESPDSILIQTQVSEGDSTSGISFYSSDWMQYFIRYDPRIVLEKTPIPVLALNGTLDLQVPFLENLNAIENALIKAGNKNLKIFPLQNLNHLFQITTTGSPSEYATNTETFNEDAMQIISDWILHLKIE